MRLVTITWDQKFLEVFRASNDSEARTAISITSDSMMPVVETFKANYARAFSAGTIIRDVAFWSLVFQQCLDLEIYSQENSELKDLIKQPFGPQRNQSTLDDSNVDRLFSNARTRVLKALHNEDEEWKGACREASEAHFAEWFERMPSIRTGLDTMLASMLVNAWTAYETFAADLWISALNGRPDPLALTAIAMSPNSDDNKSKGNQPESETLKFIRRAIELGEQVQAGSLLKLTPKFQFDKLQGIKWSYQCAFPDGAKNTFDHKCFSYIAVLEAIRNILVHRGGKVDKLYLKRVRDNPSVFTEMGLDKYLDGEHLRIDGVIVRKLLDEVYWGAAHLSQLVDSWHKAHPE